MAGNTEIGHPETDIREHHVAATAKRVVPVNAVGSPLELLEDGGSVSEKPQAMRVDDVGSAGTTIYQGWAAVGTATSAASWRIRKVAVSGDATAITWADGDALYNNVWDNRAALSYS